MHTTHLTQILGIISGIDLERVVKARESIEKALPVVERAAFPDDIEGRIRRAAMAANPQEAASGVVESFGIARDAEFGRDFGMGWFEPENVGPQIQHLLSPTIGLLSMREVMDGEDNTDVLAGLREAMAIADRADIVMLHDTTPIGILRALREVADHPNYADTALANQRLTAIANSLDEEFDTIDADASGMDIEAGSAAGAQVGVPAWGDEYLRSALEVWRDGDAVGAQKYLTRTLRLDREAIAAIFAAATPHTSQA